MLTIDEILHVSFPAAKAEALKGRHFIDLELERLVGEGLITFRPLGAYVEGPDGTQHNVQQISVPLTWTRDDERRARTENARIEIVVNLIKNGLKLHDFIVRDFTQGNRLIFSRTYHYDLGLTVELPEEGRYVIQIYSAFVPIPLELS